MFGALLFVVQHFVGEGLVFFLRWRRAGACRRWGGTRLCGLVHADEQFWRGAGQLQRVGPGAFAFLLSLLRSTPVAVGREAQEEHIGAGIDGAQGAIDLEAVDFRLDVEALREDGLEDIAGGDVLLGRATAARKVLLRGAVVDFELCVLCGCFSRRSLGSGWARRFSSLSSALDGFVIGVGGFAVLTSAVTTSQISLRT